MEIPPHVHAADRRRVPAREWLNAVCTAAAALDPAQEYYGTGFK
jgi:hypothetical protein